MTKREWRRLDMWKRRDLIQDAAADVDSALNLFGPDAEPISALTDAESEAQIDRAVATLLAPDCACRRECDHAFPPRFVRAARPAVLRLARLVRYEVAA